MTQYALSKKTVLGVAPEATPGTAASAISLYVPTKHTYKRMIKHQYITDDRGVLDENNDVVALVAEGNHSLKGEFYADTSPYFIYSALGQEAAPTQPDAVNAPTAWLHTMTPIATPVNGQLPTLTLFKSYQTDLYQMPYAVVEKFSFKLTNTGTLQFDADAVSNQHATMVPTWSPSISTVHPMSGNAAVIKVNNANSLDVDDIEIDFEQKYTFWYSGSQDYIAAYPGGRSVKFKFTARFDSDVIYNRFVSETLDSLEFIVNGVNLGTVGQPTYQSVDVTLPVIHYDTGEHDTSKDNITVKMAGVAIPSGAELIQVKTINTKTTAYSA
jgi:hypothetical protein